MEQSSWTSLKHVLKTLREGWADHWNLTDGVLCWRCWHRTALLAHSWPPHSGDQTDAIPCSAMPFAARLLHTVVALVKRQRKKERERDVNLLPVWSRDLLERNEETWILYAPHVPISAPSHQWRRTHATCKLSQSCPWFVDHMPTEVFVLSLKWRSRNTFILRESQSRTHMTSSKSPQVLNSHYAPMSVGLMILKDLGCCVTIPQGNRTG